MQFLGHRLTSWPRLWAQAPHELREYIKVVRSGEISMGALASGLRAGAYAFGFYLVGEAIGKGGIAGYQTNN